MVDRAAAADAVIITVLVSGINFAALETVTGGRRDLPFLIAQVVAATLLMAWFTKPPITWTVHGS